MRFGLHALGIGDGARPEMIRAVEHRGEARGFARLWAGEHVVMVDEPALPLPYAADGRIAVPGRRRLAGSAARHWASPRR